MQQVNIHDAKTHLSKLIEQAVKGESFVIAKSGKPMVTVSAYTPPPDPARRLGFLKDRLEVPEDFDAMGRAEIQAMFEGAGGSCSLIRTCCFGPRPGYYRKMLKNW